MRSNNARVINHRLLNTLKLSLLSCGYYFRNTRRIVFA